MGLPYIDVRVSFNSFIPSELDEKLAGKLVDYYINKLNKNPSLHDKVEFSVVHSCYTFDIDKRLSTLKEEGFTNNEILDLKKVSSKDYKKIINPTVGLLKTDSQKIFTLNELRSRVLNSDLGIIEKIYWLLEHTKRYGTLPFAGLARSGFIAIQLLQSLVDINIFSESDYHLFLSSLSTVTGQLSKDRNNLDKIEFLKKYGHLRPGTYDIQNSRYDENPDLYFDWENKKTSENNTDKEFKLSLPKMREIVSNLKTHSMGNDAVEFLNFIQKGIEEREKSKFNFTRNISDILKLIKVFGERYNFAIEDLAYADINSFKELFICSYDPKEHIQKSIEAGKELYEKTLKINLPPLITKPDDIWSFELPKTVPNFITQKSITARVSKDLKHDEIIGKIVCIKNADPGFDWLFSYPIAGFITAWGGANSHMAIRANELSLPAVIGLGEPSLKNICLQRNYLLIAQIKR